MRSTSAPRISLFELVRPIPRPTTNLENEVLRAQQQLLIQNMAVMATVNAINATIIVVSFWKLVPPLHLLLWALPLVMHTVIGFVAWRRFRNKPIPANVSGKLLRKASTGALVLGVLWGLPVIIFHAGSTQILLFLSILSAGMAAGTTSLINPLPHLASRFIVGCIAPVPVANLLFVHDLSAAVVLLAIVLMIALIAGSLQSFASFAGQVATTQDAQAARRNLLDAISSLNDAFSLRDAEGRIVLKNERYTEWFGDDREDWDHDRDDHVQMVNSRWLMRSVRPTAMGGQVCIHTDVTRLKNRERELIAARAEAEAADAAKTRFLSTMSHELRTPLNIILGFSKLMSRDSNIVLTPETTEEYSSQIHASAEHLLTLITDIIDYSKIGLEKYMLDRRPVNIASVLQRAIQLAAKYQKSSSIKDVEVLISPKLGEVVVDRMAFQRILVNLLTNAFKFQRNDPRVIIKAGLDPQGRPIISVRDFGVGMSEKTLERAFEAFYQAESEMDRTAEGTGLGLTLSQRLTKLHGGDLKLVSRLGAGTTAIVILPAEAHLPGAKEAEGAPRLSA